MTSYARPPVNTPQLAADLIEKELADGCLNPNVIAPGSVVDEALRVLVSHARDETPTEAELFVLALQHPGNCESCGHRSDCALHNRPALPIAPCDCGRVIDLIDREIAELEAANQRDRELLELLTPGVMQIALERRRQVDDEGFTAEHDRGHAPQLFDAAGEYATAASVAVLSPTSGHLLPVPFGWPWEAGFWKPTDDPIKNARRSGALLAAGIDTLLVDGQQPTEES